MIELRPYQKQAVEAVYSHLRNHDDNPVIVIPTGGGKTPIMATVCNDAINIWNGRVLILAHVKELLEQTAGTLSNIAPGLNVGIYSAGLKRKDTSHPVIVAGVQSVYKKAFELDPFDLVIIDEAHMIPPEGDGMYQSFLSDAHIINPNLRVIGLTATPFRMTTGLICQRDHFLNSICFEVGIKELIRDGYLCPLRSKASKTRIDTSGLHIRGGEFIANELEDLMDTDTRVKAACSEILEYTQDRHAVLIFSAGVEHGKHIQRIFQENHNIECGFVSGDSPDGWRKKMIDDFRSGKLKYLCNVNVLTTGFDAPNIDCIAMLRPTMSPGLYIQMVGRGFRLHPSKTNCIAEGQRILTDQGLIPIERVTTAMRVWDGFNFVNHNGVICKGEQDVINYAGIVATPDHQVWTKEGWKTLRECSIKQTPIIVTGIGRKVIRETDGYFRTSDSQGKSWKTLSACEMQNVWPAVPERLYQYNPPKSRLSNMRTATTCSAMACAASIEREGSLYEPPQSKIPRLWWPGNRVSLRNTDNNGNMDSGKSRHSPKYANRQNRQQRSLRTWKFALSYCEGEYAKQAYCRRVRVWDIVNAGPRHQFTCEGLLVSNCTVLDFGGNILRHGPVDCLRVTDAVVKGDGDAPAKECPQCNEIIHAAYAKCPTCGYEFPPPEKTKHETTASTEGILSDQASVNEYAVEEVLYNVHTKKGAKTESPRTMRVQYKIGFGSYISEWICFEHSGFARQKAESWWKQRSDSPVPDDSEMAVFFATNGRLKEPIKITVKSISGQKFDQITGYQFEDPEVSDWQFNKPDFDGPDYVQADDSIPF